VSPLSLVTFFAAAKKVTAAPHRGNARAAKAQNADASKKPKQQPYSVADTKYSHLRESAHCVKVTQFATRRRKETANG